MSLETYAAFTHAGLTTRCRTKILYKRIFVLSKTYFRVVKVGQYLVYDEDRKSA